MEQPPVKSDTRVFLLTAFDAPFIQDDISTLKRHVDLRVRIRHGLRALPGIVTGVLRADVVICWFASVYAFAAVFIARCVGVKTCVIVAGVDAARDEELRYGIWLSPWRAKLVRYVYHHATKVLTVDGCLRDEVVKLAGYDGKNIAVLPFGFNSAFWRPMGGKEPIVLTVAVARDGVTVKRKGLDTLIAAARKLPGVTFVIVGTDPAILKPLDPPMNVRCQPKIPREDLLPYYQRARVYCQPSRREGLPNALCEAMLCDCIPVGSDVSGIPTAIGDAGFLVPPGDADALVEGLRAGLASGERVATKARARIVSLFPPERRESGLLQTLRELLS